MPEQPRQPHLRPRLILAVILGGMVGVATREALILAFPYDDVPWIVGVINIAGAFLLGFLLDLLPRFGPDTGGRRVLRLFVGTGVLGGFTTYSALATDAASLTSDGLPLAGLGYALVSVIVGVLAGAAGMRTAAAVRVTPRVELTGEEDA
ncbi:fluoride efflux transporter FluC [Corynebacterium variabile]|uniref:fluoride efflux transporter FluC n=1 Tax=Corynebacterium variabile TaxID=1727 RepID=UPI001D5B375F|nr:CrcB family protein [Corynebacterium variabile]HJG45468.1 CrcB family protein [Corynebacterium variabile]